MGRNVLVYRSRPRELKYGNFGDELSLPLLERLFGLTPIPTPMQKAELIAVGSVLDAYSRSRKARQLLVNLLSRRDVLHVWGSGFMLEDSSGKWPRRLEVHAVRGELSATRIKNFAGAIGDPGILASRLVTNTKAAQISVCLVPHFVDEQFVDALELPRHWRVVHPDSPVLDVISQISQAETVISSSLHGLIVADSFGIPAIWAASTNALYRNSHYKFYDHASARRAEFNQPQSYASLLAAPEKMLIDLATAAKRPIDEWQDRIIDAFPKAFL